jgi:hypothetical protein
LASCRYLVRQIAATLKRRIPAASGGDAIIIANAAVIVSLEDDAPR